MLSHRQGWSFAVVLVIFPYLFAAGPSDPPAVTYRTGTSEVRISFFATDENNRLVRDVKPEDLAVVDSGMVIRNFRSLNHADETALEVIVLIDASESMAPTFQATLKEIMGLITQDPLVPESSISIITIAGIRPTLVCSSDCASTGSQQLVRLKADGATPLFDSLTYSARMIGNRHAVDTRQLVLLFSDGGDTISLSSPKSALDALIANGAVLYTISPSKSGRMTNADAMLRQMAEATGGRSVALDDGAGRALRTAMEDQRASFLLTYQLPSRAPGFHSLRILPKHNLNLHFHCRRGYYYDESR